MVASIGFLIFIYYPIALLFLNPPHINTSIIKNGFFVQIPKIGAQAKIIPNINPWNRPEYMRALQAGVAQAKGTSLPGQRGTMYLFAHSSQEPWEITRDNIPFLRLGELNPNDIIYIYRGGRRYIYKVAYIKEVWPNEVGYLLNAKKNQLILQTCTPVGTDLKRLLVFANPQ